MGAFWDAWNKQGQVNQQEALAGLQQVRGLAGLMQEARAMQDQQAVRGLLSDPNIPAEEKRTRLLGLVRDPAQAASMMHAMKQDENNAAMRQAQIIAQSRLAANSDRQTEIANQNAQRQAIQSGAQQSLAQLLAYGTNEPSASGVPTKIMTDEDAAIRDAQERSARGERVRTEVLDPGKVRALSLLANPNATIAGLLKEQKPTGPFDNVKSLGSGSYLLADPSAPGGMREVRPPERPETPRLSYDATRGVVVDLRTGVAAPAKSPDGAPLQPKETSEDKQRVKLAAGLPQAKQRVALMEQNLDRLDSALKELDETPGLSNITGTIAGRTPNLTNEATGAQAKLNSIKSQIFVNALQAMREASKTGGAVGNVSDKEGDKLERVLGALDQAQGTPDFKNEIKKIRQQLRLSKEIIRQAFVDQYGDVQPPRPQGGKWEVVR